jgi:hypothetical protein
MTLKYGGQGHSLRSCHSLRSLWLRLPLAVVHSDGPPTRTQGSALLPLLLKVSFVSCRWY